MARQLSSKLGRARSRQPPPTLLGRFPCVPAPTRPPTSPRSQPPPWGGETAPVCKEVLVIPVGQGNSQPRLQASPVPPPPASNRLNCLGHRRLWWSLWGQML